MKSYISIIIGFLAAVLLPVLGGCADEPLYDRERPGVDSNAILFTSSIAFPTMQTRGADENGIESYEPLIIKGSGMQLYLHGYSAYRGSYPEIGDAPIVNQEGATRGVQIRDMDAFTSNYKNFTVKANYQADGSPYFDSRKTSLINKDNAIWRPQGGMYWPGQNMLTFYAWAPADLPNTLTGLTTVKEQIHFNYEAPKASESEARDADIQPDLVFAASDCNKQEAVEGRAPLRFHHALSAVKFAVRDVVGGVVKQISLHNIYGKGECAYFGVTDENGKIMTDGEFKWKVDETYKTSYYQNFDTRVESTPYSTETGPVADDRMLTDDTSSKVFMLIPQELSEDAEIEVVFERDVIPAEETAKTVVMRGRIKDAEHHEWLPGREYVYSISTSSANWSYVFKVVGSYRNGTEVFMPCPDDYPIWDEYYMSERAKNPKYPYFEVTSFRFRSNNPTIKEELPWDTDWEAKMADDKEEITQWEYDKSYGSFANKDKIPFKERGKSPAKEGWRTIKAKDWLTAEKGFSGDGSLTARRHNVMFAYSGLRTTWSGDADMYGKKPYGHEKGGYPTSKELPWDLSRFERVDRRTHKRNTANSYVVDRGGWYCFPLYYGNSITDDIENPSSYTTEATKQTYTDWKKNVWTYSPRQYLTDYKGTDIKAGKINPSYYASGSAHLLWQDAYNLVDEVELVKDLEGEPMIRFHVVGENIQQGNVVIGLIGDKTLNTGPDQSPNVIWSWHIWTNEHWLNDDGVSNAFSSQGFDTEIHPESQMRKQGDLKLTVPNSADGKKTKTHVISPYNVGWCDAKNVLYLARFSEVKFTQYEPGKKKPSGKTASLDFIQEGSRIDYKYGNNVYYQFGRKDPFVGFVTPEDNSLLKDNFGPLEYKTKEQKQSLAFSIKNPHMLFVGASADPANNDWLTSSNDYTNIFNLWNNSKDYKPATIEPMLESDMWHQVTKTIYDPSPAGYVVPPAGVFKILFNNYRDVNKYKDGYFQAASAWTSQKAFEDDLNGEIMDKGTNYKYKIYSKAVDKNANEFFVLTATGHRWYASSLVGAGNNFNPHLAYLWTCNVSYILYGSYDGTAMSIAVGNDYGDAQNKKDVWIISTFFNGRRAMARPMRPIREKNSVRSLNK